MSLLIYIIAFIEGFTTLSIEIIALRRFTPLIDSNSISTSIILGVILLALSYGYYQGGKNSSKMSHDERIQKVILNLTLASGHYLFFTFTLDTTLLAYLLGFTENYFLSILLAAGILFFIPIFLASQTLPLLSEILEGENLGEKMGKILFFSTIGSFLGSVMTSSLFFSTLGVGKTATLSSVLLSGITILLLSLVYKKIKLIHFSGIALFILSLSLLFDERSLPPNIVFETANAHHSITIYEHENKRIFSMNGGLSSGIDRVTHESYFRYIQEIKKIIIEKGYKNILIIGAAGFTLPQELAKNGSTESIDVIDIDASLREIAQQYFLEEPLSEKIHFFSVPARYFLTQKPKKYDVIVVDIYIGKTIPPATMTLEFFRSLRSQSENIFINLITDSSLTSDFSKRALSTMEEGLGGVYFKDVIHSGSEPMNSMTNYIMTNVPIPAYTQYKKNQGVPIYTDDRNSIELDLFSLSNSSTNK